MPTTRQEKLKQHRDVFDRWRNGELSDLEYQHFLHAMDYNAQLIIGEQMLEIAERLKEIGGLMEKK